MLLVRTYLAPSPIHGFGVFAKEFIPKGTVVWRLFPNCDILLKKEDVELLPKIIQETIKGASVLFRGEYFLYGDNTKFINHSKNPNLTCILKDDIDIAASDIFPGEELTEDYQEFQEGENLDELGLPNISIRAASFTPSGI